MNDEPKPSPTALAAVEPESRSAAYPLSRLSARIDLVDVASEIQEADRVLGAVVGGQLDVIAEQIRGLQDKARQILARAELAAQLHRARCSFKKRPGHVYHLYRRSPTDVYLSLLSPGEWGGVPPHPFEGSFRLEVDMAWTRVDS
ncbi:MAG: DUF2452 domain-containing protein [Polyangiaceae bacterium]|jgi:hypothetical protein|nr:DUF2452 domain-containing protein [Polyangiaceae bacterium]MBK8942704.1 DUF2452 domain-containing protein [Polyangiaceae bacterium]